MTPSSFELQKRLYGEKLARIKETDVTVPYRDHGWFYYQYQHAVEMLQYPIYCRKRTSSAKADDRTGASTLTPEQVLLDLNETGREHKFVELGTSEISDDGRLFAFALDTTGFRQFELQVKDFRTDKLFPETIPRVDRVAWSADGKTLFYVFQDATTKRANRLYRHVLATDKATDVLVYEEKDKNDAFILMKSAKLDRFWAFGKQIVRRVRCVTWTQYCGDQVGCAGYPTDAGNDTDAGG
jgi:oligopeptidase B